jgi:hypothetical protein
LGGSLKVSDLIGPDVKVSADGSVTGTFPYVKSFPEFSNNEGEQSGHYFPFTLTKKGSTMTFKKNGQENPAKTDMAWEQDNIFRVENPTDTFEVSVDGEPAVTLNFKGATLSPNPIAANVESMTVKQIKALAAEQGVTITSTSRADVVKEYKEHFG